MDVSQDSCSDNSLKSSNSNQSEVEKLKYKSENFKSSNDIENLKERSSNASSSDSKDSINNQVPDKNNIGISKLSFNNCIKSQMKKHHKNFSISEKIQVNRLPKVEYLLEKKVCSVFNRKKINFILTSNDKTVINQTIDLKQGSAQFQTNQTYFINFTNEKNIFNLKQENLHGKKFMSITYSIEKEPFKHKISQITFYTSIPGLSNQLLNIPPKINSKGKVLLPFGNRKVLPSTKNMIFTDPNKSIQNEIVAIMKVSKSTILIEAISIIPEEMIFVIGVSSFLNHSS